VWFYISGFHNVEEERDDVIFMVTLPVCSDESIYTSVPDTMMKKAYLDGFRDSLVYFRVTEDQWHELTGDFFESRKLAEDNLKKVRFTYEELFSSDSASET